MSAVHQHSPSQQEKRESSTDRPLQGLGHRPRAWILFSLAKAFAVVLQHVGSLIHLSRKNFIFSGAKWNAGVFPETSVDGRCAAA